MLIRRACAADAAIAARIIAGALAEYTLSFEPEGRDADVRMFGAREDTDDLIAMGGGDDAIGVASVGPHEGGGWISKLFVAREHRGRGVGRALLAACEDAARARGFAEVGLRTRIVFVSAVRLYEAAGYVAQGPPAGGDVVYRRALTA